MSKLNDLFDELTLESSKARAINQTLQVVFEAFSRHDFPDSSVEESLAGFEYILECLQDKYDRIEVCATKLHDATRGGAQ